MSVVRLVKKKYSWFRSRRFGRSITTKTQKIATANCDLSDMVEWTWKGRTERAGSEERLSVRAERGKQVSEDTSPSPKFFGEGRRLSCIVFVRL